jgi:hypothetical protein
MSSDQFPYSTDGTSKLSSNSARRVRKVKPSILTKLVSAILFYGFLHSRKLRDRLLPEVIHTPFLTKKMVPLIFDDSFQDAELLRTRLLSKPLIRGDSELFQYVYKKNLIAGNATNTLTRLISHRVMEETWYLLSGELANKQDLSCASSSVSVETLLLVLNHLEQNGSEEFLLGIAQQVIDVSTSDIYDWAETNHPELAGLPVLWIIKTYDLDLQNA